MRPNKKRMLVAEAEAQGLKIISRQSALADRLPRYFTGKLCKRGHVAERLTHGGECCACVAKGWTAREPSRPYDEYLAECKARKRAKIEARDYAWRYERLFG